MTKPVRVLEAAENEALQAAREYEAARPGMGHAFFDRLSEIEASLREHPDLLRFTGMKSVGHQCCGVSPNTPVMLTADAAAADALDVDVRPTREDACAQRRSQPTRRALARPAGPLILCVRRSCAQRG